MPMPNFFIVGAGRTGTTSLYHYLSQHPDVFMCPVKEPMFFAYEGEPPRFNIPGGSQTLPPYSAQLDEYRELYRAAADESAIGEASVDYLYLPRAAERIRHHVPDARIIILLRQPLDRAYSQFWSRVAQGLEPERDFETAFNLSETRCQENWPTWFHYKQKSFYADALRRYLRLFAREQVKILLHEDYHSNPVATFQDTARFLGIDGLFVPDTEARYNLPRGIPKATPTFRVVEALRPVLKIAKPVVPSSLRAKLNQWIKPSTYHPRPPLDPELRAALSSLYQEDILEVQELIGRNLGHWLRA